MLKFDSVLWAATTVEQVSMDITMATQDIAEAGDMVLKIRPWKHDENFIEIGVWTENMDICKRLYEEFSGGRVWIVSPRNA